MTVNRNSYLDAHRLTYIVLGMEESLQSRLKSAIKESEFNQTSLAKRVGVSQPTMSDLCNIEGTGSTKIVEIAHLLGVRPLWLATGRGARYESETQLDDEEIEIITMWRKFPKDSRRILKAQFQAVLSSQTDLGQS